MSSSDCNLLVFGPVPATRPLFPDNDTAVPVPRREEVDTQDEEQSCKNTDAFRHGFPASATAAPHDSSFRFPFRRRRTTTTTTVARERKKERKKETTRARFFSRKKERKKERKKARCFLHMYLYLYLYLYSRVFFFCFFLQKKIVQSFSFQRKTPNLFSLSLSHEFPLSFVTRRREHARSREDKERERETTRART